MAFWVFEFWGQGDRPVDPWAGSRRAREAWRCVPIYRNIYKYIYLPAYIYGSIVGSQQGHSRGIQGQRSSEALSGRIGGAEQRPDRITRVGEGARCGIPCSALLGRSFLWERVPTGIFGVYQSGIEAAPTCPPLANFPSQYRLDLRKHARQGGLATTPHDGGEYRCIRRNARSRRFFTLESGAEHTESGADRPAMASARPWRRRAGHRPTVWTPRWRPIGSGRGYRVPKNPHSNF